MSDRLAHNLRCLEDGLAASGFQAERRFPTGMQLYVSTEQAVLSLAAFSAEDGSWIVLYGSNPARVPADRRLAVADAIARINYQQVVGNFDIDLSDGEMRYRIGHATDVGDLTPELVQRLVGYVLYVWAHFHEALMRVAYGGSAPADAVAPALVPDSTLQAEGRASADEGGAVDVDAILKDLGLDGPIQPSPPPLPFPSAYVVPGTRLIAGEYPGDRDREAARRKVRQLIEAGVTRVFDLTRDGELVSYEKLLWEEASARSIAVVYHRRPIRDVDVCAPEQMRIILDEIDGALAAGETVYVHCWGGVGRTGTVIGCWLVRHGRTGDAALCEVQTLFESMPAAKVERHPEGSPQTPAQRRMVLEWGAMDAESDRTEPRRGA